MNVLFALYNEAESNSGIHVISLARELCKMKHECVVAVPSVAKNGRIADAPDGPPVMSYRQAEEGARDRRLFRDGGGVDVFHAWTPRGLVRDFYGRISAVAKCPLIVHLEDNEDELVKSFLGIHVFNLAMSGRYQSDFPVSLTHPLEGRSFIRSSCGATMLIEAMQQMIPPEIPPCIFWPAADNRIYFPRDDRKAIRTRFGLPETAVVIAYTGNSHPANYREVRSLYLAVHLLNRRGIMARLVRTGKDVFGVDREYKEWASRYAVELGHLEDRRDLGELLAMADVLVQPGKPDPFNDYRFPSKLPEFFASGRPVILPRTNIGLATRHLQDAYVLDRADGPSIADAVEQITRNPTLEQHLAKGARDFYIHHFSWEKSAAKLSRFYAQALADKPRNKL